MVAGLPSRAAAPGAAAEAGKRTTAKFIQICASRDDLFALDEDANIDRYNFSTKAWVTLDPTLDRSGHTSRPTQDEGPS